MIIITFTVTINYKISKHGSKHLYFLGSRFGNLSIKVALAYIMSNFYVKPCETTPTKMEFNPKGFTLASSGRIYLKYEYINVNTVSL